MKRPSWDEYFMEMAELTAKRSTCMRRNVGAVIVKEKHAIATGYNGAPRGIKHCEERGGCLRQKLGVPSGQRHELCMALHAEQNAMLSAERKDMINSTLYIVGVRTDTNQYEEGASPCQMCRKLIINSGISEVIVRIDKNSFNCFKVKDWINNDDLLEGKLTY